ncbi:MAG: sensor histidine kinase [Desulfurivibrionaceae bacterium]
MKSFFLPSSIRNKIIYGFALLLSIMVGTMVLTYGLNAHIEKKLQGLEVIDNLFGNILELRRFEKNYFLYGEQQAFDEATEYIEKTRATMRGEEKKLGQLTSLSNISYFTVILNDYERQMNQLNHFYQDNRGGSGKIPPLKNKIREKGKELTSFAEKILKEEKSLIQILLKTIRHILITGGLVVLFLSLTIAAFLGRKITKSLKLLEEYAEKISREEIQQINIPEIEIEVKSVLNAFNRMSRMLSVRQRQLVRSEKLASLGTLLSGVAHELNNPLSNISTSTQILAEEIDGDDTELKKEMLKQMNEQSDKARDIVKNLLEFSRAREYKSQAVDLKKLLDETLVLIRGQIPTEVEIIVEITEEIRIEADKQKLQQALLNLIKNSIDAVGKHGKIWVSAHVLLDSNSGEEEIELMVEDNGPGIEPDKLKKIFDPFYTTKDVGHGSGLGLYIVHDIVENHGGKMEVNSQAGQGTNFTIWLPKIQEKKND